MFFRGVGQPPTSHGISISRNPNAKLIGAEPGLLCGRLFWIGRSPSRGRNDMLLCYFTSCIYIYMYIYVCMMCIWIYIYKIIIRHRYEHMYNIYIYMYIQYSDWDRLLHPKIEDRFATSKLPFWSEVFTQPFFSTATRSQLWQTSQFRLPIWMRHVPDRRLTVSHWKIGEG
jgi:hypothetical protein